MFTEQEIIWLEEKAKCPTCEYTDFKFLGYKKMIRCLECDTEYNPLPQNDGEKYVYWNL